MVGHAGGPPSNTWTIRQCIGAGGFGEVYRVERPGPGGTALRSALKVVRLDMGLPGEGYTRLQREASALAALRHPNIVTLQDLVSVEVTTGEAPEVGLLCELVEGDDLDGCMRAGMPARPFTEAAARVADALHTAWTCPDARTGQPMQLVHRDIKPSNVRVGHNGDIKLIDFGIVYTEYFSRLTRTGAALGTVVYMPPEAFCQAEPTPASDIYALGVMLLQGLGGAERLWEVSLAGAAGLAADAARFDAEVNRRVESLHAYLPDQLTALIRNMIAHAPQARPAAATVAEQLEALAPELPGPSLRSWCRAHSWPATPRLRGRLSEGSRVVLRPLTEGAGPAAAALDGVPRALDDDPADRTFRPAVVEHEPEGQPARGPRSGLLVAAIGALGVAAWVGAPVGVSDEGTVPSEANGAVAAVELAPEPAPLDRPVDIAAPPAPPAEPPRQPAPRDPGPTSPPPHRTEAKAKAPPTRAAETPIADAPPTAPVPQAEPTEPPPVMPRMGVVRVRESVGRPLGQVRVRGPDGVSRPVGEVPAGRSILTVAPPEGGSPITASIDVPADGAVAVTCMVTLRRCTVDGR